MDAITLEADIDEIEQDQDRPAERYTARIRLLYHVDLRRIGDVTPPDTFNEEWSGLGRLSPDFVCPTSGALAPLADPYISRAQAALRWEEESGCFWLQPAASSRLKLAVLTLTGDGALTRAPVELPTKVPPGSMIDVGGRALLLAEFGPWRGVERDRMSMIGESEAMWELREVVRDVSTFDRAALVLGETGVGKEMIARGLHHASARKAGPFVAANCAALPDNLVESLLFGHKKGAFTGATDDSAGLFQDANAGTIFLDEIGELPIGLQPKLLRTLEESEVTPVGARSSVKLDTRVLAATNRDPHAQMRSGHLRPDLYYRLAAHLIKVPPLRDRRFDVPLLFQHFLALAYGQHPSLGWMWEDPPPSRPRVPMEFFLELMRYPWPGNVRELQNLVEQTARLNLRGPTFTAPELDRAPPPAPAPQPAPYTPRAPAVDRAFALEAAKRVGLKRKTLVRLLELGPPPQLPVAPMSDAAVTALERHLARNLFALLEREGFNQSSVAACLGVSRGTLIRLMKRFDLPRANDLELEAIAEAREATGGTLEAMSERLNVSPASLKARLTQEGLLGWLE